MHNRRSQVREKAWMAARARGEVSPRLIQAAQTLAIDSTTIEVVGAMRAEGIRSILLKGPVLSRWLYPEDDRPYGDTDLLVAPDDVERAQDVLERMGFQYPVRHDFPGDRPLHARPWMRPHPFGRIDLHRTLIGTGVPSQVVWQVLSERTERMWLHGTEVEVLDRAARTFHLALHAAQHGTGLDGRPLEDLSRAIARAPAPLWDEAATLAARLGAVPAFSRGLRLLPEGREVADRLALPTQSSVELELRSFGAPQLAFGLEWLARTPGLRRKMVLIARKLVPPPGFMRAWYPSARKGRLQLLLTYVWRPLELILRLGPALRAWSRARKAILNSSGPYRACIGDISWIWMRF
jgi:hypothetical protein